MLERIFWQIVFYDMSQFTYFLVCEISIYEYSYYQRFNLVSLLDDSFRICFYVQNTIIWALLRHYTANSKEFKAFVCVPVTAVVKLYCTCNWNFYVFSRSKHKEKEISSKSLEDCNHTSFFNPDQKFLRQNLFRYLLLCKSVKKKHCHLVSLWVTS